MSQIEGTRQRIYEFIKSHPGMHLRAICRELGLAVGDLQYHLYALERQGMIKTVRRGLRKFIYPSVIFGDRAEKVLSVLSQETPREIILNVIQNPDMSQMELAERLGLSQPTIFWHMKRLKQLGLIISDKKATSVTYHVVGDARKIVALVQSYYPSVWERWASRLLDIILTIAREEGVKKDDGS